MRSRAFIVVAGIVVLLLVAVLGTYAYDRAQRDTIAAGVEAGGVDVGGLDAAAARAKLEQTLRRPFAQPVVVTRARRRFALSPRIAGTELDVDAMVRQALERSRAGTAIARVGRGLTGGEVDARVPAEISYDPTAVDRFVAAVAARLDRRAAPAAVEFSGSSLGEVSGRDGVTVQRAVLRARVVRALRRARGPRTLEAPVRIVRPKRTAAQLAERYPTVITVDRARFRLHLWKDLRLAKTYTVAIGAIGLDTPAGLYSIQNKAIDPVWSVPNSAWAGSLAGQAIPPGPSNPIKARWMGIFDGAGIHGTDQEWSLGSAASHGCVRMAIPDVIELYDQTPVGTPIYIG